MGLFTAAGSLVLKNGLSPFAKSAYGAVPTGAPASARPQPSVSFDKQSAPGQAKKVCDVNGPPLDQALSAGSGKDARS